MHHCINTSYILLREHTSVHIHCLNHTDTAFPNHRWMKHDFRQPFVSQLIVSKHGSMDTPTSSPLCFILSLPLSHTNTPTTSSSAHTSPCQTPQSDRLNQCSMRSLTYTFIYTLLQTRREAVFSVCLFSIYRSILKFLTKCSHFLRNTVGAETRRQTAGAETNNKQRILIQP